MGNQGNKPCPFCGHTKVSQIIDFTTGGKWGFAMCSGCNARAPDVRANYDTRQSAPWRAEALEEWNKRAEP